MSRNIPNVNASLIREVRMIAKQFFGSGREDNYYSMRIAEAQAKAKAEAPGLSCVRCVRNAVPKPRPAQVIYKGDSLCIQHLSYV